METGRDTGQTERTGQDQAHDGTAGQDRTVTVTEAAAALGLTTEAVRKRLQRGQLAGVKIGGAWFVHLDRTSESGASPAGTRQDRTAGQRARPVQREAPATRQLIEQLRAENDFLKDELRRKDVLLMTFAGRLPELSAPAPEPVEPSSPTPRRSWWSWLTWG